MTSFAYNPVPKTKKPNTVTFKCTYCSIDFERKSCTTKGGLNGYSKRFCSSKCHIAYKKENGREYSRPSQKRNPDFIYRNGRAYKIVKCVDCGTEIERRVDQIKDDCRCRPCINSVNGNRMIGNTNKPKTGAHLNCRKCGIQFYYCASKLHSRKYCSRKCMHEWQTDHQNKDKFIINKLRGEDHPRYKHGRRVGKHIGKPKLRNEIIERDGGNWCLLCGKPGPGLHLHRVIYGAQGGQYENGNCVLLCGEDHALVHSSKKKWQEPLLKYLADTTLQGREWLKEFQSNL